MVTVGITGASSPLWTITKGSPVLRATQSLGLQHLHAHSADKAAEARREPRGRALKRLQLPVPLPPPDLWNQGPRALRRTAVRTLLRTCLEVGRRGVANKCKRTALSQSAPALFMRKSV